MAACVEEHDPAGESGPWGRCLQLAQRVKNLSAMQEIQAPSLDQEDPLEKGMATHSSTLARRIPCTGAWRDTVHGVTKSQTQLKQLSTHIDHNTSFTLLYLTYHIDILFISHHHKKGEYSTIRHFETQRKRETTSQVLLQYIVIITPFYYPLLLLISEICLIYKLNFIIGRYIGFPSSSDGKESACNAGDLGLIPGSGRSPAEGTDNPLQYSCLENPMDREA